jgi:hypothetical protein
MNRVESVKQQAEDLAMTLIGNGLVTDDPLLVDACNKLKPFQAKLGMVNRDVLRKGLDMVKVELHTDDDSYEAKLVLNQLIKKLESMKWMFGLF